MQSEQKKAFKVKVRSLGRVLKEYKNYKLEVEGYDLNAVSQNKRTQEFYMESKSALGSVEKSLIEYLQGLSAYIEEHRSDIEEDETVKEDYESAMDSIAQVKQLLPAAC